MIEEKELGLKIVENPEEAFWKGVEEKSNKAIEQCRHEIIIQKSILNLAIRKSLKFGRVKA